MKKLTFQPKTMALFLFVGGFLAFFMGAAEVQAIWTSGGPYGGDVTCLAMAPLPDIIYAGTNRGVFKTVNAGATWTQTAFPTIPIRTIRAAPPGLCQAASATIGTAEPVHVVYVGSNIGIYKSEDGLETWDLIGPFWETISAIAVDPLDPCVLYAGAGEADPQSTGKIFKSTDGGETWEEKVSGWMNGVEAFLIDPDNSDHVYAGAYGTYGFWKSTNKGENWAKSKISSGDPNQVYALAMTPAGSSPDAIYAIDGYEVYKSTDSGDNWVELANAPSNPLTIAVDPNNPNVIYSGNRYFQGRFYKSTDAGDTWSVKDSGIPQGGRPSSIVIDLRNSALYVGLPEGAVFKSTDGADNWSFSSQGMTGSIDIADLALHPASSNTLLAAVKGDGHCLAKTTTGGSSWEYLSNSPTHLGAVAVYPQNPQIIWAGDGLHFALGFYVYKSTDGGQSWTDKMFFYFISGRDYTGVTGILIKGDNPDAILVGTDFDVFNDIIYGEGVLARTTDGGETWEKLGLSTTALAYDPNDPDVVYRGRRRAGQVIRHTEVWDSITTTDITPAGGIGDVRDIEVDSDSTVYVAAGDSLWRWDNPDWITLSGLPTDNITALAIDRSTSPGIIYVGTEGSGVFVSIDGGSSWTSFNEGLGSLFVTKLAISATQPKMLYAGTSNDSVWNRSINPPCEGDFTPADGDVDGSDLAAYIADQAGISLNDFAAEFGRTNCPFS
ncbi:MAG: WD40/YVTN/BNR-like repeat-containing protein [Planctomycetota bacterium]